MTPGNEAGFQSRTRGARLVIEGCKTEDGFRASRHLYPELWLRDLVFSEWALLRLGYSQTVKNHLRRFMNAQRRNGQVPNVINGGLRAIFNPWFHPWTSDSEPLLVLGLSNYIEQTQDEEFRAEAGGSIARSLEFATSRLERHGLMPGMDWRDALINYHGRVLLSNQLLLIAAFRRVGMEEEASRLRKRVLGSFYSEEHGYFADSIWWEGSELKRDFRFDSLGNSLALMLRLHPEAQERVLDSMLMSMTSIGCRNLVPAHRVARRQAFASLQAANAFLRNGAVLRNRIGNYQNSTVWPFVEIRVARAMMIAGRSEAGKKVAAGILGRPGFSEWYHPQKGEPRGSRDQLWTAGAVIEAEEIVEGNVSGLPGRFP